MSNDELELISHVVCTRARVDQQRWGHRRSDIPCGVLLVNSWSILEVVLHTGAAQQECQHQRHHTQGVLHDADARLLARPPPPFVLSTSPRGARWRSANCPPARQASQHPHSSPPSSPCCTPPSRQGRPHSTGKHYARACVCFLPLCAVTWASSPQRVIGRWPYFHACACCRLVLASIKQ